MIAQPWTEIYILSLLLAIYPVGVLFFAYRKWIVKDGTHWAVLIFWPLLVLAG